MYATHIVKNADEETVGYLVDNVFYTDYYLKQNIELVENIAVDNTGRICSDKELPCLSYAAAVTGKAYHDMVLKNPFMRDIQADLEEWKQEKNHGVLQLEGSRQIGKTTELLKFAYRNYEYVLYVNFASDEYDFKDVIQNGCRLMEFEKYCRRAGLPHFKNSRQTILVLDEIQVSEQVYNAIRSIAASVDCDIVVTGSYLGQTIKNGYFLPAGTVTYMKMYPLSFTEFCRIYGKDSMLEQIDLYGNSAQSAYDELFALYDLYRYIGGYPAVIKKYIDNQNKEACYQIIADLLNTFEKESRNYFQASKETVIFKSVYREAMIELCRERKGSGSKLVELVTTIVKYSEKLLVSRDEIANAIMWLIYSGIIGECGCYVDGDMLSYRPARRLYYMDCGIAGYLVQHCTNNGEYSTRYLRQPRVVVSQQCHRIASFLRLVLTQISGTVFHRYLGNAALGAETGMERGTIEGILTETFVFAELHRLYTARYSKKKVKGDTPSFSILGSNELDFLVFDKENKSYGIEVKTTDGAPKSLRVYRDKRLLDRAVVAKRTNGGHDGGIETIPVFAVGSRFPYDECV